MARQTKKKIEQAKVRFQEIVREVFAKHAIAIGAGYGHAVGEGRFECLYGSVNFTIYDDWVHFCLEDFVSGGNAYRHRWYGFDHWKQNFHTFIGQWQRGEHLNVETIGRSFIEHVDRLFRDNGSGVPTAEELSASKTRRAERDRAFSKAMREFEENECGCSEQSDSRRVGAEVPC